MEGSSLGPALFSPVTLEELSWLDRCQRRVWLDHLGDPAARVAPALDARARSEANRAHVRAVIARLPRVTDLAPLPPAGRAEATRAAMGRGDPLIAGAVLEAAPGEGTMLRGTPHLLRRDGAAYTPIHIRLHAEPTRWDRTHLDALRWLVGAAQGIAPPAGELWLGARGDGPAHVYVRRADASAVGASLAARYRAAAQGSAPPIWFDADHCPFCHWRAACDRAAIDGQDLALIPALRRPHARVLRERGVLSVPQVAALDPAAIPRTGEHGEPSGERIVAYARALRDGAPVALAPAPLPPRSRLLFLDVETDPLSREPWAVGWLTADGRAAAAIVAPGSGAGSVGGVDIALVPTAEDAWAAAADAAEHSDAAALHWGDAEGQLLARSGGAAARATLAPRLYDLHASLTGSVALPIPRLTTQRSAGLKTVAGWLGHAWPAGADHWSAGWESYRAFREAHASGDAGALALLEPALAYLRADLTALAVVWRWFAGRHERPAP